MATDELAILAQSAGDNVQADPGRTVMICEQVLARDDASVEAVTTALWARGLAAREIGELVESERWFALGLEAAGRAGLRSRAALIRLGLALTLANSGRFDDALAQLALARPDLDPGDLPRLDQQAALVHQRRGDLATARTLSLRALDAVPSTDPVLECRILSNLGVLEGYTGQVDQGIVYMNRALDLARRIDQSLLEARALQNLGFLEGQRGDVPAGLRHLAEARRRLDGLDDAAQDRLSVQIDECHLLLDAGLHDEAVAKSDAVLSATDPADSSIDTAEFRLLHARSLLAAGMVERAELEASNAARLCRDQGRDAWRWTAEALVSACHLEESLRHASTPPPTAWRAALDASHRLEGAALDREARRARLVAVRLAIRTGGVDAASIATGLPDPASEQVEADRAGAWLVTAELRLDAGDRRGARSALRAGLRAAARHQRRFGSFELRATAARAGVDLARTGLRLAIEDRNPTGMLRWAEANRAGALRFTPGRPPSDPELANALYRLRALDATAACGTGERPVNETRALRRGLEAVVSERLRGRSAGGQEPSSALPDLDDVHERLGDRTLVEYATLDGDLHALIVTGGRVRHVPLGPMASVDAAIDHLRFALNRLARSARGRDVTSVVASLVETGELLDRALIGPLALDDRAGLVIVPASRLHDLAWAALPSCRGRGFVVAPSAVVWARAESSALTRPQRPGPDAPRDPARHPGDRRPPAGRNGHLGNRGRPARSGDDRERGGSTLVVAGPDLDHADIEAGTVGAIIGADLVLSGADATVDAVSAGLGRSSLAHLACHGSFRSDNPLFSSLRLADGLITPMDLELLPCLPSMFVLPACQAGSTAVRAGEELLGITAALLSLGACTVVAPVSTVSDEATSALMIGFYRHLARGGEPSTALAAAAAEIEAESPQDLAAARSFITVGAATLPGDLATVRIRNAGSGSGGHGPNLTDPAVSRGDVIPAPGR